MAFSGARVEGRDEARVRIVQTANRFILAQSSRRTPPFPARLLGMRQVQQAVCVVRRNRLVSDADLKLAGYRPSTGGGS